jgi:hypothetical protein
MTFWLSTPVCFLVYSADGQPFHVDIPPLCPVVCARAGARRFPCGNGSGRAARAEPAVVTRTRTRPRISHDFLFIGLTRTMAVSDTSVYLVNVYLFVTSLDAQVLYTLVFCHST